MTRREFEITDLNEIISILDKAKYLHLGLVDGDMPYIVPMNYGYKMDEGKLTLFLHSAKECYKLDLIKKNPTCCFQIECDVRPFYGRIPCMNGTTYSSLMGRGRAVILESHEEREAAMKALVCHQTGEDCDFSERLLSIVSLIRIDVDLYTAKKRPLPAER